MSANTLKTWDEHLLQLRGILGGFPDRRTGGNLKYSMQDIGLGAFSVFFTQCPSFLAHQKTLQQAKGQSKAQSLFHLEQIPCDNHIREMLDPVPPEKLFPCYDQVLESLRQAGHLESWRVFQDKLLLALDGTWYYSSQKIHCPNCSCLEHKSGDKTYYHSAVTPVIEPVFPMKLLFGSLLLRVPLPGEAKLCFHILYDGCALSHCSSLAIEWVVTQLWRLNPQPSSG